MDGTILVIESAFLTNEIRLLKLILLLLEHRYHQQVSEFFPVVFQSDWILHYQLDIF